MSSTATGVAPKYRKHTFTLILNKGNPPHVEIQGASDFWRWVHKGDDVAFTTNIPNAKVKVEFKSTDDHSDELPFGKQGQTIEDMDFHRVTSTTVKFAAWCHLMVDGKDYEYVEAGGQHPCAGCPHNP
jgi:hypothetical protein